MAEIRKIFADENDIREMLDGNPDFDIDAECIYAETNMFGPDSMIVCWSREMQLDAPGRLKSPATCYNDCFGAMRRQLQPFVDGLEHCAISMIFGCMLDEKRDSKQVFEVKRSTESVHTVVFIRYPADEPVGYINTEFDSLQDNLGLRQMFKLMPSVIDDSYGVDVLVLKSDTLDEEFWEQERAYERFRDGMTAEAWADFEVSRGYYRSKMEDLQSVAKNADMELNFQEDFAWLQLSDKSPVAERFEKESGSLRFGRCWYDDTGLSKLKTALMTLAPAAGMLSILHNLDDLLGGGVF